MLFLLRCCPPASGLREHTPVLSHTCALVCRFAGRLLQLPSLLGTLHLASWKRDTLGQVITNLGLWCSQ